MSKWEWKKLGDLYPIVMGKTPPRGDPSCWDKSKRTNNVWVTIADISSNENQVITESKEYISDKATKNISLVSPKSLLLSFKLSIGKMAFAGVPLYTNEAIVNFPPIKDIDLHYLHKYFLYYNWDKASEGDTKVKGKTLNKEKLKNIDIPVPPLSEQNRIVKFLDEEFSKIDTLKTNAETNLKNAKELFETTLEKELNPLSHHSERSEESCAELPSGWEWIKISTLVTKCLNIKWDKIALNDSRLYIDLSSVNKDTQCIENVSEINVENAPSRAKQIIHEKDVLFATTRPTQKRVCIVEREFDNQICSTGFCVLRPQACLESKYLFYCLLSDDYYSYIKPLEKGANYPAVTDGDVKNYEIPLPPLSVQKEIVARLDKLSENVKRLEANYKQIIADCDELKKSILKKTFERKS